MEWKMVGGRFLHIKIGMALALLVLINLSWGWYYTAFQYRMPITLSYPTTMTDVQVLLNIPYNSHMKSDYSDLRFTYFDGSSETPVPFWVESYDSSSANVWVRVPSLGPSTQLYVYYGNPSATSASDGDATFFFFDDFSGSILDPAKWQEDPGISYTLSGGELTISQQLGIWAPLPINVEDGYTTETRAMLGGNSGSYSGVFASPMSSPYTRSNNAGADATLLYMVASGTTTALSHYFGNGCAASYNIHSSNLPDSLTLSRYYIFSVAVENLGGSWRIDLMKDRNVIHSDTTTVWCKSLNNLRLGFFTRGSTTATKTTTYDWVLVRKTYDMASLSATFGPEEVREFVEVAIVNPANGAFVSSPFTVSIEVNLTDPADIALYVDSSPITSWSVSNNTTLTYSLSLAPGSHTLEVVGNTSLSNDGHTVSVVVLSSGSSGGSSVCYSCIAKRVWSYKERSLTQDFSWMDERLEEISERMAAVERLEKKLADLERRLDALEERMAKEESVKNLSKEFETFREIREVEHEQIREQLGKIEEGLTKLGQELEGYKEEGDRKWQVLGERVESWEEERSKEELYKYAIVALSILSLSLLLYILHIQRRPRWRR